MTSQLVRTICTAVSVLLLGSASAIPASAETGTVRYTLTAEGPWQAHIVYYVGWRETRDEHVWLAPDSPWETAVTLDNPYNWAGVTITGLYADAHPRIRCEIWVNGKLADHSLSTCGLHPRVPVPGFN